MPIRGEDDKRLQCPLCTTRGALAILDPSSEYGAWKICCKSCMAVITLPAYRTSYFIYQTFAYRVPERGKEQEDYEFN